MKRYLFVLTAALAGCSFFARSPDAYRAVVREMLDQKRPDIQACYASSYAADPTVQGRVIVRFKVEPKTGKVLDPQIVPQGTTASEPLKQCVLRSLEGVKLEQPDQRMGDATFMWDFAR